MTKYSHLLVPVLEARLGQFNPNNYHRSFAKSRHTVCRLLVYIRSFRLGDSSIIEPLRLRNYSIVWLPFPFLPYIIHQLCLTRLGYSALSESAV